ncbi:MAG TPA: ABC transporter substrate-binding protein, partial [Phototrophicaceae bacterium]|nr:ABC transporter substrate-binding protein [Phototrophicaceae bacterium]
MKTHNIKFSGQKRRFQQVSAVICVLGSLVLAACAPQAPAQQTRHYTIGVLTQAAVLETTFDSFKATMTDLGYVEGTNTTYIYDGPISDTAALDQAAQNLAARNPDLIYSMGSPATTALKKVTTTVPVIFGAVLDPIQAGIVTDLKTPGGNFTGIRGGSSDGKAIEWLLKIVPGVSNIFIVHLPQDGGAVASLKAVSETAKSLGVKLTVVEINTVEEIQTVLETVPEDVDAFLLLRSGLLNTNASLIIQAANARNLPTTSADHNTVKDGALVAYGADFPLIGKQAASLADQ